MIRAFTRPLLPSFRCRVLQEVSEPSLAGARQLVAGLQTLGSSRPNVSVPGGRVACGCALRPFPTLISANSSTNTHAHRLGLHPLPPLARPRLQTSVSFPPPPPQPTDEQPVWTSEIWASPLDVRR